MIKMNNAETRSPWGGDSIAVHLFSLRQMCLALTFGFVGQVLVSDCRFGVSPVNYPDPDLDGCRGALKRQVFFSYFPLCSCLNL